MTNDKILSVAPYDATKETDKAFADIKPADCVGIPLIKTAGQWANLTPPRIGWIGSVPPNDPNAVQICWADGGMDQAAKTDRFVFRPNVACIPIGDGR